MKRIIIVALLALTAFGAFPTGVAHASRTSDYLDAVRDEDVPITKSTVTFGRQFCRAVGRVGPGPAIDTVFDAVEYDESFVQDAMIVEMSAAVVYLCPQHKREVIRYVDAHS